MRAAAADDRHALRQRIDTAEADARRALDKAERKTENAADATAGKWAQRQAGAAATMAEVKATIDRRNAHITADLAGLDADMAEDEAVAAIDYARWAIDNARLTTLYALEARAHAEQLLTEKKKA